MKTLRWLLGFINAALGKRPITAISAHEVPEMLGKMEGKGRYESAQTRDPARSLNHVSAGL